MQDVFIVVKDETDYNGDITYPKVFNDRGAALNYCEVEKQKAIDWVASMREAGENVGEWIPSFYVEESKLV